MSDSQKFPVAAHALAYLAFIGANCAEKAAPSARIAASMPTNPVVVRRVTAQLARAGLIGSRPGARGGAWLTRPPEEITLEQVLRAVGGCAQLGSAPPGVQACPVGRCIPGAVERAIAAADAAAAKRLSAITVADLLKGDFSIAGLRAGRRGGLNRGLGRDALKRMTRRLCLITGASSGIGAAFAKVYARQGTTWP